MAVTIKDVAKQAGVSFSTVSKVINNWPTISEPTINRVHQAMRELDYTPNSRASNFARRETKEIGLLMPLSKEQEIHTPRIFRAMCGMAQSLSEKGYILSLVGTSSYAKPEDAVHAAIAPQALDGIIAFADIITPETAALINKKGFPHIIIGRPDFDSRLCWLETNNVLAGEVATRHLADTDCKNIVFISDSREGNISKAHMQGFLSVMHEYELPITNESICWAEANNNGYDIMLTLLSGSNRPDAIICESNQTTIRVLKALWEQKIELPKEISLITFDDYPHSHAADLMPTAVDIDVFDFGMQIGSALLQKIKTPALQVQSYTTLPTLIQRSTTRKGRI